jgi:hypothetical protein
MRRIELASRDLATAGQFWMLASSRGSFARRKCRVRFVCIIDENLCGCDHKLHVAV